MFLTCRKYSMQYTILCSASGMSCVGGGAYYMINGQIPYGSAWVPWDCTSFPVFFFTCVQVIISILIGIYVNVATETTVLGICLQICARFEILAHRLRKVIKHNEKDGNLSNSLNNTSNKTSRLSEHVYCHLRIIRFVKRIIVTLCVYCYFSLCEQKYLYRVGGYFIYIYIIFLKSSCVLFIVSKTGNLNLFL